MTLEDRNDAMLVKIIHSSDDGKETMVSSYYTTAIDQTLKMFITAKDHNIECCFNDNSSVVSADYLSMTYIIEDIYIRFGSKEDLPVIEVYI